MTEGQKERLARIAQELNEIIEELGVETPLSRAAKKAARTGNAEDLHAYLVERAIK